MTMNPSPFETGVEGSSSGKANISPSATNFSGGGYHQVPSTPSVTHRQHREMIVPEDICYYENPPQQQEGEKLLVQQHKDVSSRMVPKISYHHHQATTALNLVGSTGGSKSNVGEGQVRPTRVTTMTRRDALSTFRPASDSKLIKTPTSSLYGYNNGSTTSNNLLPPNHGDDTLIECRRSSSTSQGRTSSTNIVSRRASASHVVHVSDPTANTTRTTRRHSSSMDTTTQPHLLNISGRKLAPPPPLMMSTTPVRSVTTHDVRRGQEAEGSDWKQYLEANPSFYQNPPPPEVAIAKSSTTGTTAKGAFHSLNSKTTDITMVKPVRRSSDPTTSSSSAIHTTTGMAPTNKTSNSKPLVDEGRSRIVSSADKLRFYRWTQNRLPKEDTVSSLAAITKSNTNKDERLPKDMKLFKSHRATLSAFYPNMNTTTTTTTTSTGNNMKMKKHDPQVAKQRVTTTTASATFFYSFQPKSAKVGKK